MPNHYILVIRNFKGQNSKMVLMKVISGTHKVFIGNTFEIS